jgi:hypothetical protein
VRDESDEILDDLLSRWYWLRKDGGTTRGHAKRSLVVGDYRDSRQYDDANGKLDADADESDACMVDAALLRMDNPYRIAIEFDARNLYSGLAVWRSARLPENSDERDRILLKARVIIKGLLYIEAPMKLKVAV